MTEGAPVLLDLTVVLAQAATSGGLDVVQTIATGSGPFVIVLGVYLIVSGKLRVEREVLALEKRIADNDAEHGARIKDIEAQRDEYKRYLYAAIRLGEKVADVVEERSL